MSDIYFQPSLIESHGLSVVEAMRYGLPCVVSNTGGLPESVVNGKTGHVVGANDIDGMVDQIVLLLRNPALRETMGRAGCERYETCFEEHKWNEQMSDIHIKIINQ